MEQERPNSFSFKKDDDKTECIDRDRVTLVGASEVQPHFLWVPLPTARQPTSQSVKAVPVEVHGVLVWHKKEIIT